MFKLAVRFAASSALLCTACGDDYAWGDSIHAGLAVIEIPSRGGYSLEAQVELARQDEASTTIQVAITQEDSQVELELPPGSYAATLESFTLYRDGVAIAVGDVTFVGYEPDPIVIEPFTTTRVTLTFREEESGEEIGAGGDASLVVTGNSCSGACTAAQICANVNNTGAACYDTCDDDTPCAAAGTRCVIPAGDDSGICF